MLVAVEVPGLDIDADDALDLRRIIRIADLPKKRRVVIDDAGAAPDFQPPAAFVVDDEQQNPIVFRQIPDRDVLLVAGKIGEGQRAIVEHLEKARRSAAVLDVRPAIAARGADEETVGGADIGGKIVVETITRRFSVFSSLAQLAAAVVRLRRFDGRRERQLGECAGHQALPLR